MGDPDTSKLLATLAESRATLLDTVSSMPDEERLATPIPDEWTAHQQIAHLAEMENIWLDWALEIAHHPGAVVGEPNLTVTPSVDTAHAEEFDLLIQRLTRSRQRTIAAIDRISADEIRRVGCHRLFGPMSVLQCLRAIYRHDRVHERQICHQEPRFVFPKEPQGLGRAVNYDRRVRWAECDASSVWRFTAVLSFVEEAEVELLREVGILDDLYGRIPRTYVEAQYKRPARFDDLVTVHLALTRIGDTSLHYDFAVFESGELAVRGRLGTAFVDADGASERLPSGSRLLLESWLAGPNGDA